MKKKTKRIPKVLALWGFFIAILISTTLFLSPIWSIFQFSEGFIHNNPREISSFVDYHLLRVHLKHQFSSYERRRVRGDKSSFGFLFHPIREAITSAIIDQYVNSSLPRRILAPDTSKARSSRPTKTKISPVRYEGAGFQSSDQFTLKLRLEVSDPKMKGQVLGLVFSRRTLFKWVLTDVRLGDPMIHAIFMKAQQ